MNIILPGLHGSKEDPVIRTLHKTALDFGNTQSLTPEMDMGEFGMYGNIEAHIRTLTNYLKRRKGHESHLIGHSLGGLASLYCAEHYANRIRGICLYNTAFGGLHAFSKSQESYPESTEKWQSVGYQERHDQSGNAYQVPWDSYWESIMQYDAIQIAKNIRTRCSIITSTEDIDKNKEAVGELIETLGKENPICAIEIPGPHVAKTQRERNLVAGALKKSLNFLHEK